MLPKEIQHRITVLKSRLIGIDKRLTELSAQKQELSDYQTDKILTVKIKDLLATKRNITRMLEEIIHMVDKNTGNDSVFDDDVIVIPKRYKEIYDNTR
jgi:hypothetical protein